MWFYFGILSILATTLNIAMYAHGKDYKLPMALAISFAAFSVCASYSMTAEWVLANDISALNDVVPYMANIYWWLIIVCSLLNVSPIFLEMRAKSKVN